MVSLKTAIGGLLDIFARKGKERRKLTAAERKILVDRIAFLVENVPKALKLFGGGTHHGSHTSFHDLGGGKFMLRSENPGHGFLVEFSPLFFGRESLAHGPIHRTGEAIGEAIERPFRDLQDVVNAVGDFFAMVQRFPEEVAAQVPRFGESPEAFFERRRAERGEPLKGHRNPLEQLQDLAHALQNP